MNDWAHLSLYLSCSYIIGKRQTGSIYLLYMLIFLQCCARYYWSHEEGSMTGTHSEQDPACEVWSLGSQPTPPRTPKVLWTLRAVLIRAQTAPQIPTHHPQLPLSQSLPHSVLNVEWCRMWASQPVKPVSQPARKRGQGHVLTVSSGSIKCYCVCRQLLTVHFVSVWGGQLWREKQKEKGEVGASSNTWHMFLSFWFPLRSLG